MNKLSCGVLGSFLLVSTLAGSAKAASSLDWMSYYATEETIGIGGWPTNDMDGAPYLRYSVDEVLMHTADGWWTLPLDWVLEPVDEQGVIEDDYGTHAYRAVYRTYRVKSEPSKLVEFRLMLESLPWGADWEATNGPAIRFSATASWLNGIPSAVPASSGRNAVDQVALVVRSDHDIFDGQNNSGVDAAWGTNGALSAVEYGAYARQAPFGWPHIPTQPLARLFDTNWASNYAAGRPISEIMWLRSWDTRDEYQLRVRTYADDSRSWNNIPTMSPQTVTEPGASFYAKYVKPGAGSDQVVYMHTTRPAMSTSSYEWQEIHNLIVKRDAHRAIELRWYYHDAEYGDPDRVVDDNNSVRKVLQSLDKYGSPVYINTQQTSLTCPGGECSDAELLDLEYWTNPDYGGNKSVLKTAVYVLERNQAYNAGGVVFPTRSRGFVFPKMLAQNTTAIYKSIAHEIGHTFKFEHSWGRCPFSNPNLPDACWQDNRSVQYCCVGGDIMSYAHVLAVKEGWDKLDFNYTDDAKRWFNEAPWSFVEPYVGGSLGAFFPDDNNGLEPGQVLGW
jgi:hypothetical protein